MRRFLLSNFSVGERNTNEKNHPATLTIVVIDLFILGFVSLNSVLIKFHLFKTSTASRSCGNNGAAALLLLAQFKALVMKGGFMVIIRCANVSGCYALEQGTCPGLIAREPRRHFLAFAYGERACLEKYI